MYMGYICTQGYRVRLDTLRVSLDCERNILFWNWEVGNSAFKIFNHTKQWEVASVIVSAASVFHSVCYIYTDK
jgi:hypothetical protein